MSISQKGLLAIYFSKRVSGRRDDHRGIYLTKFDLSTLEASYLGGAGDALLGRKRIDSYKGVVRFFNGCPIFNFFDKGIGYLEVGKSLIRDAGRLTKEVMKDYELEIVENGEETTRVDLINVFDSNAPPLPKLV